MPDGGHFELRKVLIQELPFGGIPTLDPIQPWNEPPQWPCRWIAADPPPAEPAVVAYRCSFELKSSIQTRLHVTADESYELYINGQWVGAGSEHGDRAHWFYDTYDLTLHAGQYTFAALVNQFGRKSAAAQVTLKHGWLCAPEDAGLQALLGTGIAPWQAAVAKGIILGDLGKKVGGPAMIGPAYTFDLREWPADWWKSDALGWSSVKSLNCGNAGVVLYPAKETLHLLRPATLPSPRSTPFVDWTLRRQSEGMTSTEINDAQSLLRGEHPWTVPAGVTREVLFDSDSYLCAHSTIDIEGGRDARIELAWAEMIRRPDGTKCSRDNVDGEFKGLRDVVIADGTRRTVRLPRWRPGRFLQLRITTAGEPLTIHRLSTTDVGYPLDASIARWNTGDPKLDRVMQTAVRTVQACAHDTFMDCPFYEQLQYIGDVQIQSLVTYCLTPDASLARQAIELMLSSRNNPVGLPMSAHPSKGGSIIAPFALALLTIVHDFAMWRGDAPFVASTLPALRGIIDWFLALPRENGLVRSPFGWNFIDANLGQVPPGGEPGKTSALINWQLVVALLKLSELEAAFGERELATRADVRATELADRLRSTYYDASRGRFRDSLDDDGVSEHGQILPVLSGLLNPAEFKSVARTLVTEESLKRTGASYTHLLFEAYYQMGRSDLILQRLEPWTWAIEQGFKTFPEYISLQSRSDCHGWSAHPLYHYYASVLGIRPAKWGFDEAVIEPRLNGRVGTVSGTLAHPKGPLAVELQISPNGLTATVDLPAALTGVLIWQGERIPLAAGSSRIERSGGR